MSSLRLLCVSIFALGLTACSIDKAPTQPPRKIENPPPQPVSAPQAAPAPPTAAPAAPSEEPESQVQASAVREEPGLDKPNLFTKAEYFAFMLRAAGSVLQKPAGALPPLPTVWTKQGRKLLALARAARWQSEQDLYVELLRDDLLLYVHDERGQGIFHWLAQSDQIEIARQLVRAGLVHNLRTFDLDRRQPLHFARSREMAKLLLDEGNDPQATDTYGLNPFEAMLDRHETEPLQPVAQGLCDAGHGLRLLFNASPVNVPAGDGQTFLERAAAHGNVEAISSLLACPESNILTVDSFGRTALHAAACARRGSYAATYALLAHFGSRARIDATVEEFLAMRDGDGETALSLARKCENEDTARLLRFFSPSR